LPFEASDKLGDTQCWGERSMRLVFTLFIPGGGDMKHIEADQEPIALRIRVV
jgi:hypothetical protein